MQAFQTSCHSTTAVKAIWKLQRPLYSPLSRCFVIPYLCHDHRSTIIKLLSKLDWENFPRFFFHKVANKRPYIHYTLYIFVLTFGFYQCLYYDHSVQYKEKISSENMANQKLIWLTICRIAWSYKMGVSWWVCEAHHAQCEAQAF